MSTQGQGDVAARPYAPGDAKIQIIGIIRLEDGEEYKGALLTFPAGPPDMKVLSAWDGTPFRIVPADEHDRLRTLLSSSRGEQGWRTMDVERLIVSAYVRGHQWCHENGVDHGLIDKAARDYADYVISTRAASAPGSVPTSLAGQVPDIIPMGRENDGDKHVTGYMCLVDFECEIGLASGGNIVYPSIEECREGRKCVGGCGIVEVEIRATRVVQEPSDDGEVALAGAEIEAQSSPQPTAGGDAPRGDLIDRLHEAAHNGMGNRAVMLEAIDALSAERARVIELESALKGAIANLEHVSVFDEADDDDQEAIEARSAWQRDLDRFRAALRALGQQDTGGADHG
jgi:hypothetical protein